MELCSICKGLDIDEEMEVQPLPQRHQQAVHGRVLNFLTLL